VPVSQIQTEIVPTVESKQAEYGDDAAIDNQQGELWSGKSVHESQSGRGDALVGSRRGKAEHALLDVRKAQLDARSAKSGTTMTLLVLLATTTGTWLVAPHLRFVADGFALGTVGTLGTGCHQSPTSGRIPLWSAGDAR